MTAQKLSRYGVIITTNPLNHEGGVVAFYNLLLKRFDDPEFILKHLPIGSRMMLFHSAFLKRLIYPVQYLYDLSNLFISLLRHPYFGIVQINPSLIPVPLIRDGIVLLLATLLNRKVIVLFHGWKNHTLKYLVSHRWASWLLHCVYSRASIILVLSSRFRDDLISIGWESSTIEITTTMFESDEIIMAEELIGGKPRFLFLGRISQLKGIGELLKAARTLKDYQYNFELIIVGHGACDGIVREYEMVSQDYGLGDHIQFTGRLTGKEKYRQYANSDIFVFPSWTEGCPTSVLEALGAGLFVISTDVGALRDIIHEDKNGKIVRCNDPEHLAALMKWGCDNIDQIRNRRALIQKDARDRYEARIIVDQFSKLYKRLSHE